MLAKPIGGGVAVATLEDLIAIVTALRGSSGDEIPSAMTLDLNAAIERLLDARDVAVAFEPTVVSPLVGRLVDEALVILQPHVELVGFTTFRTVDRAA